MQAQHSATDGEETTSSKVDTDTDWEQPVLDGADHVERRRASPPRQVRTRLSL